MLFKELLNYIDTRINNERRSITFREYRLDRMRTLLTALDNPQDKVKAFHITGSKGKGTTAKIIQESLTSLNYKVGTFSSPHIFTYRERFLLDGKIADESIYDKYTDGFFNIIKDFKEATTFELLCAFAFYFFYKTNCDYMVIEVGLGGRLDATNVLKDSIALLTSIEYEHVQVLGNTLEKITFEKASIYKSNLFVSYLEPRLYKICKGFGKCYILEEHLSVLKYKIRGNKMDLIFILDGKKYEFRTSLVGQKMAYNIALSVATLVKNNLYNDNEVKNAINNTTLEGRLSLLNDFTYIDPAHTKESISSLYKTLKELRPGKNIISIFALIDKKDYKGICPIVQRESYKVCLCKPSSFKESNMQELSTYFDKEPPIFLDIKKAYDWAIKNKRDDDIILCTGSFYLISLLYKELKEVNYEL